MVKQKSLLELVLEFELQHCSLGENQIKNIINIARLGIENDRDNLHYGESMSIISWFSRLQTLGHRFHGKLPSNFRDFVMEVLAPDDAIKYLDGLIENNPEAAYDLGLEIKYAEVE